MEGMRVVDAAAGRVVLADGRVVRAGHVLRQPEAYTASLPRLGRRLARCTR